MAKRNSLAKRDTTPDEPTLVLPTRQVAAVWAGWGAAAGTALTGLGLLVLWLFTEAPDADAQRLLAAAAESSQDKSVFALAWEAVRWKFVAAVLLGGLAGVVCFYGLSKADRRVARLAAWAWPVVAGVGWVLFSVVNTLNNRGDVGGWALLLAAGLIGACLGPLVLALLTGLDALEPAKEPEAEIETENEI